MMNLKKATLFVIIGISYTFLTRTIGTFFPDLFMNPVIAHVSMILGFLASLALVLFFVLFNRDFVSKDQVRLRRATLLAIVGSSLLSLLHVKGLMSLYGIYLSPYLLLHIRNIGFSDPAIRWIASIIILIFFMVFYDETKYEVTSRLWKPTLLAVFGNAIVCLIQTVVLFVYFVLINTPWSTSTDMPMKLIIIVFPFALSGFALILYFFLSFYRAPLRAVVEEDI